MQKRIPQVNYNISIEINSFRPLMSFKTLKFIIKLYHSLPPIQSHGYTNVHFAYVNIFSFIDIKIHINKVCVTAAIRH